MSHRQLPSRVTVHPVLRGDRLVGGAPVGVALLEAGAGGPSDANGRKEPPMKSRANLGKSPSTNSHNPTPPVGAEQSLDVAGVVPGIDMVADSPQQSGNLARVGVFGGSGADDVMRLAFVRTRLEGFQRKMMMRTDRIHGSYSRLYLVLRCTTDSIGRGGLKYEPNKVALLHTLRVRSGRQQRVIS